MPRFSLLLLLFLCPALALAQTLVTVNGEPITEAMVLAANPAAQSDTQARQQTLNVLISRMLLAQRAERSDWLDAARVRAALATQRLDLLANAEAQHYWQTHPISEKELQSAYDKALAALPKREYRLREIVVTDVGTARTLLQQLRQGVSFSELAAERSTLPNAALGGEMGWLGEDAVPAPYLKFARAAKPGEVFGPIVVPQGWAILQVLGIRETPKPSLASVRGQLETALRNESLQTYVDQLKKSAQIIQTQEDARNAPAAQDSARK